MYRTRHVQRFHYTDGSGSKIAAASSWVDAIGWPEHTDGTVVEMRDPHDDRPLVALVVDDGHLIPICHICGIDGGH